MRLTARFTLCAIVLTGVVASVAAGQRGGAFRASRDHPAIAYSSGPVSNLVSELNQRLRSGAERLEFQGRSGYLRSVLRALDISVDSQVAVFSQTSFQASLISSDNPRAIYFSDSVAVAWVRGGDILEVAAQDRRQGTIFYVLDQSPDTVPQFRRNDGCLACHLSWDTLAVPGLQTLSVAPLSPDPRAYATGFVSDHRSPFTERWGGWYVTGSTGSIPHMGNIEVSDVVDPPPPGAVPPPLSALDDVIDSEGYPSAHSDAVALMVLNHQAHMTNLITRLGWEARRVLFRDAPDDARFEELVTEAAAELVDYMLFVDEAPLTGPITGSSRFSAQFAAREPRDRHGRSLREFDLEHRLFRYPCSYMIYTPAFDALPDLAKTEVYQRLWEVLSGQEHSDPYTRLTRADRQAIVEILRDTKPDLPAYFQSVTR